MAIDRQIFDFYPHTVTIAPFASKNNYGEDVTGSTRTAKAYIEPNASLSRGVEVDEKTVSTTAYINDLNITLRDVITLPDGRTPVIVSVQTHTEVLGLEHSVVQFA